MNTIELNWDGLKLYVEYKAVVKTDYLSNPQFIIFINKYEFYTKDDEQVLRVLNAVEQELLEGKIADLEWRMVQ